MMKPHPEPRVPEPTEFTVVLEGRPGTIARIPTVWVRGGAALSVPTIEFDEPDTPIIVTEQESPRSAPRRG
ncbi:MAG TPA: hypothetical protein VMZ71_06680 [Gemmataceae bacterium]|nr:hypothetical protein [Gemmataceae bacterium]